MNRTHCVVDRACSWLRVHTGAWIIGLAVVWTSAPRPAFGQSAWPSYPNNNAISVISAGNVGIGTTSPSVKLSINGSAAGTQLAIDNGAPGDTWISIRSNNATKAYFGYLSTGA